MILRSATGGSTPLPTHQQQQLKMVAWGKGNGLALATIVQPSCGSDEDPHVGLRSPACISLWNCCYLFCCRMKIKSDSIWSRWDLSSDGFWSKRSIRELLSLPLLRHKMVWYSPHDRTYECAAEKETLRSKHSSK